MINPSLTITLTNVRLPVNLSPVKHRGQPLIPWTVPWWNALGPMAHPRHCCAVFVGGRFSQLQGFLVLLFSAEQIPSCNVRDTKMVYPYKSSRHGDAMDFRGVTLW